MNDLDLEGAQAAQQPAPMEEEQNSSKTISPEGNIPDENSASADDASHTSAAVAADEPRLMRPSELEEILQKAYLKGRNENIEARIEADCAVQRRTAAGELLVKGLTGVAKVLFRPGRRSIWPGRRS